jgi:hypothetical protein
MSSNLNPPSHKERQMRPPRNDNSLRPITPRLIIRFSLLCANFGNVVTYFVTVFVRDFDVAFIINSGITSDFLFRFTFLRQTGH